MLNFPEVKSKWIIRLRVSFLGETQKPESMATVSPQITAARGKRQKLECREKFDDVAELSEQDFSKYDHSSEPYCVVGPNINYMNDAMRKQNEACALYWKQSRNCNAFDAIPVPENSGLLGCVHPQTITDDNRPLLIQFCNYALEKYNVENQNAKFEFVELIKFNTSVVNGLKYYITFEAKVAADPLGSPTHTFQAVVWHKFHLNWHKVLLCRMKPT